MGLFSRKRVVENAVEPKFTISGRPVTVPEEPGSPTRRFRLFGEAVRRLSSHPLAQPSAAGVPIGDGYGMEELVSIIGPVFKHEPSLIRWVALRGGLAFVHAQFIEGAMNPAAGWNELLRTMGFDLVPRDADGSEVTPKPFHLPGRPEITPEVETSIVGLFASFDQRLRAYPQLEVMSINEMNSDPMCRIRQGVSLDYIAWSAVAALRFEAAENLHQLPEPSALEGPGWYTEPLFAKCHRYWEEADWTSRCRLLGQEAEVEVPLV